MSGTGKTALVVDDSKSARFALRRYLEGHQYQVETAGSAEEALSFLNQHRPDVIFLDHIMPGADGFVALREIKAHPHLVHIPVVICSSSEGADFRSQAVSRGAAGVLQKPPSPEQLRQVLHMLTQGSEPVQPAAGVAAPPVASAEDPVAAERAIVVPILAQAAPPAASQNSKVANIRDPDVAIEQAVMNALRNVLPTLTARPGAGSVAPGPAPGVDRGSFDAMESQFHKLQDELHRELDDLRRRVGKIDSEQLSRPEQEQAIREATADSFDGVNETLRDLEARLARLESTLLTRSAEFRTQLDQAFQSHSEQVGKMREAVLAAAAEEAHNVAERAVMSAAARISDRLATSIAQALNRA